MEHNGSFTKHRKIRGKNRITGFENGSLYFDLIRDYYPGGMNGHESVRGRQIDVRFVSKKDGIPSATDTKRHLQVILSARIASCRTEYCLCVKKKPTQ